MTDRELLECLKDRPCEACKFHSDKGCSKWDCVFDSKRQLAHSVCRGRANTIQQGRDASVYVGCSEPNI